MKADPRFLDLPGEFWAHVRTISQEIGYTERGTKSIKVPELDAMRATFRQLGLSFTHIAGAGGAPTLLGQRLLDYFGFRAELLNQNIRGLLMNKIEAEKEFLRLKKKLQPTCPLPMNKQKGEKKTHAFFTGMVNMLIQDNIGNAPCDYDPRSLTTLTHQAAPLRTLSRRVDGAFPAVVNPIAIWEIKEYYYTTTFGSRVADGVYETLLDGMELREVETAFRRKVFHALFIDDYYTWWDCGRSYLCRLIDMLHMGLVDEIVFGREVLTRLPQLARDWKRQYDAADRGPSL